ncbi:MAG: FAD/NAD(P)-binding oxidoreductase [Candidatus Saccharimonadales bacterium]|nr:FAD/NAD(P)-binding oxidoreductase [Candidatus Saccharimonadales bacterium]
MQMPKSNKKHILIIGAGTAGTIAANRLSRGKRYDITVIDQVDQHYYQAGYVFLPFGKLKDKDLIKPKAKFIPRRATYIRGEVNKIEHSKSRVLLKNGNTVDYDLLVIATGAKINPKEIPGMHNGQWYKSIFDFYTIDGARALRDFLKEWKGGTMAVHITEMPIKCPIAPLEFTFLADSFFKEKGMRSKVKLKFITPLDGAFTKPTASKSLGYLLEDKAIEVVPNFNVERIDPKAKKLISYDSKSETYDVLVTVPTNMGDDMIGRSGLGDELNFVPVYQHTLQSTQRKNIFVVGDAAALPTSKAGSVAHFQIDTLVENIGRYFAKQPLIKSFDGHANCFIETGEGKAMLIDFNYQQEPVTGKFPFPVVGPLPLLKESRTNHWGKLAFRWVYWNLLLKDRPLPGIPSRMRFAGKDIIKRKEKE